MIITTNRAGIERARFAGMPHVVGFAAAGHQTAGWATFTETSVDRLPSGVVVSHC